MLLSISATDVAFVSVIVGGVTTIVGPLITWQIAQGARKHEREADRNRRNYEARREVYVEMLAYARLLDEWLRAHQRGTEPPVYPSDEDERGLYARVRAFGTKEVVEKLNELDNAWVDATDALDAANEMSPEDRDAVDILAVTVKLLELEEIVRDELAK